MHFCHLVTVRTNGPACFHTFTHVHWTFPTLEHSSANFHGVKTKYFTNLKPPALRRGEAKHVAEGDCGAPSRLDEKHTYSNRKKKWCSENVSVKSSNPSVGTMEYLMF